MNFSNFSQYKAMLEAARKLEFAEPKIFAMVEAARKLEFVEPKIFAMAEAARKLEFVEPKIFAMAEAARKLKFVEPNIFAMAEATKGIDFSSLYAQLDNEDFDQSFDEKEQSEVLQEISNDPIFQHAQIDSLHKLVELINKCISKLCGSTSIVIKREWFSIILALLSCAFSYYLYCQTPPPATSPAVIESRGEIDHPVDEFRVTERLLFIRERRSNKSECVGNLDEYTFVRVIQKQKHWRLITVYDEDGELVIGWVKSKYLRRCE